MGGKVKPHEGAFESDDDPSQAAPRARRITAKKYYSLAGGRELVFRDDVIGDAHVFRMEYLQPTVICDQTMKDAARRPG